MSKTFYFSYKNSEEKISLTKANDYDTAIEFFAKMKNLDLDVFLKLYDVCEVERELV